MGSPVILGRAFALGGKVVEDYDSCGLLDLIIEPSSGGLYGQSLLGLRPKDPIMTGSTSDTKWLFPHPGGPHTQTPMGRTSWVGSRSEGAQGAHPDGKHS